MMQQDQEFASRQQLTFGIDADQYNTALQEFFKYLENIGDQKNNREMKKHFHSWYPRRQRAILDAKKQKGKTSRIENQPTDYQNQNSW
jgi:hypothetical protein